MKNLAGQEVGIEVGMVCRDKTFSTYRHIKFIDRKVVAYSVGDSAEKAIEKLAEYIHPCFNFSKENICVGYHNPLGVDKNGEEVHKCDTIINMDGDEYEVLGVVNKYFILKDENFTLIHMKDCLLHHKNILRCQSEKTPEQIEEEKAIKLLTERGRIRDGKVLL